MAARRDDARGSRAKRPSAAVAATTTASSAPAASPTTTTGAAASSSRSGSGRMELMLAAAAASADTLQPPVAFHQFAPFPPSDAAAPPSSSSKHKRVKKSDGAAWAPAAAATGGMRISSLMGPPPPVTQHSISSLTAPTSSSAASLASILSAASPIPAPAAPSPTASVFQAPPAPILSFADTERRRAAAASGPQTNGKSSAGAAGPSGARGLGRSSAGPVSMLELFFPSDAGAAADAAGARDSATAKSLKRKRRADPTQPPASAAAAEYDLLRFGVDASKLVPQGLVDRVDAKMDRAFIVTLIRSHVAHWSARAGFGSRFLAELAPLLTAYYPCHYPTILDHVLASFLFKRPEFMELLLTPMVEKLQKLGESATSTKYPVVDAFARTCCYLIYHEASTSAVGGGPNDGGGAASTTALAAERARHDFACATLLQCLLESNTEKFILSPAIAACAAQCSDAVLEKLWREIVGAWLADERKTPGGTKDEVVKAAFEAQDLAPQHNHTAKASPHTTSSWRITDPLQQAFALLGEEPKLPLLRSRGSGDSQQLRPHVSSGGGRAASCRLASALARLVVLDAPLQSDATVQSSSLVRLAREAAGGGGAGSVASSSLLLNRNSDNEFAQLHSLLHAAASGCPAAPTSKASGVSWGHVRAAVLAAVDEDAMGKFRRARRSFQTLAAQACRRHLEQLRGLPAAECSHLEVATRLAALLDALLSAAPTEFAHSLLRDVVDAIRQFEDSCGAAAAVFRNVVLVALGEGKRSDVWSPSSSSPSKRAHSKTHDVVSPSTVTPRVEVELRVLVSLLAVASRSDDVGRFARSQLSTRPAVRLLTGLMRDVAGNRFKMAKLVELLDAVIARRDRTEALGSEWTRQHIVTQFVATAYSVSVPSVSDQLVGLVQTLACTSGKQSSASRSTILWATLRQCTRLCCGCSGGARGSRSLDLSHVSAAGNFAELVKVLLCSSSSSGLEAQSVMAFVQQEFASCHAAESRINLFLLLVLQRMAAVERQPWACLSVVQLAVFSIGATTRDHIRILQLQVLKALCSRLASLRSRRLAVGGSGRGEDADDCWQCEELVCNERLQCDLRRIVDSEGVGATSSRTSVLLAQSVLRFAAETNHRRQRPSRALVAVQ